MTLRRASFCRARFYQGKKKLHHVTFAPANRDAATHCIVLLHGWGQSAAAWQLTAEALHESFPNAVIIVPDLVGHGRSSDACPEFELTVSLFVSQVGESAITDLFVCIFVFVEIKRVAFSSRCAAAD